MIRFMDALTARCRHHLLDVRFLGEMIAQIFCFVEFYGDLGISENVLQVALFGAEGCGFWCNIEMSLAMAALSRVQTISW